MHLTKRLLPITLAIPVISAKPNADYRRRTLEDDNDKISISLAPLSVGASPTLPPPHPVIPSRNLTSSEPLKDQSSSAFIDSIVSDKDKPSFTGSSQGIRTSPIAYVTFPPSYSATVPPKDQSTTLASVDNDGNTIFLSTKDVSTTTNLADKDKDKTTAPTSSVSNFMTVGPVPVKGQTSPSKSAQGQSSRTGDTSVFTQSTPVGLTLSLTEPALSVSFSQPLSLNVTNSEDDTTTGLPVIIYSVTLRPPFSAAGSSLPDSKTTIPNIGTSGLPSKYQISQSQSPLTIPFPNTATSTAFSGFAIVPSPTSQPVVSDKAQYTNVSSSATPVWTPAMLGSAYGGGFIITPSIYVTKLPYPSGPSEGVPPGYGSLSTIGSDSPSPASIDSRSSYYMGPKSSLLPLTTSLGQDTTTPSSSESFKTFGLSTFASNNSLPSVSMETKSGVPNPTTSVYTSLLTSFMSGGNMTVLPIATSLNLKPTTTSEKSGSSQFSTTAIEQTVLIFTLEGSTTVAAPSGVIATDVTAAATSSELEVTLPPLRSATVLSQLSPSVVPESASVIFGTKHVASGGPLPLPSLASALSAALSGGPLPLPSFASALSAALGYSEGLPAPEASAEVVVATSPLAPSFDESSGLIGGIPGTYITPLLTAEASGFSPSFTVAAPGGAQSVSAEDQTSNLEASNTPIPTGIAGGIAVPTTLLLPISEVGGIPTIPTSAILSAGGLSVLTNSEATTTPELAGAPLVGGFSIQSPAISTIEASPSVGAAGTGSGEDMNTSEGLSGAAITAGVSDVTDQLSSSVAEANSEGNTIVSLGSKPTLNGNTRTGDSASISAIPQTEQMAASGEASSAVESPAISSINLINSVTQTSNQRETFGGPGSSVLLVATASDNAPSTFITPSLNQGETAAGQASSAAASPAASLITPSSFTTLSLSKQETIGNQASFLSSSGGEAISSLPAGTGGTEASYTIRPNPSSRAGTPGLSASGLGSVSATGNISMLLNPTSVPIFEGSATKVSYGVGVALICILICFMLP
ncbi:MAG: hypothetical protein Q9163_001686 [Psora crenata]